MRTRKEIDKELIIGNSSLPYVNLEILLDIRELLKEIIKEKNE